MNVKNAVYSAALDENSRNRIEYQVQKRHISVFALFFGFHIPEQNSENRQIQNTFVQKRRVKIFVTLVWNGPVLRGNIKFPRQIGRPSEGFGVEEKAEDDFIITSLETLQKSIIKIREKGSKPAVKTDEINVLFEEVPEKTVSDFLLKAHDSELNAMFDRSKITLTSILNSGISTGDFENGNVKKIISKNISVNTPRNQIAPITSLLNQVLV